MLIGWRLERIVVDDADAYKLGYVITWLIVFIALWVYAVFEYGYLLGVGLGWLPAIIVATLVSFLWPLLLIAVIWLLYKSGSISAALEFVRNLLN